MSIASTVTSIFPVPAYLSMPAIGLDISDRSVKFVEFVMRRKNGRLLGRYGSAHIPEGVVQDGKVVDKNKFIEVLSAFRQRHKLYFVRASLPEEGGYIFPAYVPEGLNDEEIREVLEFKLEENVPVAPEDAIIDFDRVPHAQKVPGQQMVSVSVYPKKLSEDYTEVLKAAGFDPISLEIEAQAIAHAVVPKNFKGVAMIVDVGKKRSGLAVTRGQVVRLTATIDFGGDIINETLENVLADASDDEVTRIKNEEGLNYKDESTTQKAFQTLAENLATEIDRYMVYWQTHKDVKGTDISHQPVEKIFLTGGNANIAGLPEFLSKKLKVEVKRGDVWGNAFSLDSYVPDVSFNESLGYASAVGLALHENK